MKVKIKSQAAQTKLRRIRNRLNSVPQRAHRYFVTETPIDTGNARNKTKFIKGNTIYANYPYAVRLDEGYSKQSPLGMSTPTIEFIKKIVRRIITLG
jgi:hypothetical protein